VTCGTVILIAVVYLPSEVKDKNCLIHEAVNLIIDYSGSWKISS